MISIIYFLCDSFLLEMMVNKEWHKDYINEKKVQEIWDRGEVKQMEDESWRKKRNREMSWEVVRAQASI